MSLKTTLTTFCLVALLLILRAGVAESQSVRRDVAASKAEEPVRSQQANPGVGMAGGVAPKNFASQDPAGIFDGQGNFDANAYVQAAKAYGTPAMINERFGSPWTAYHQSISPPTWKQAPSTKYINPTNPFEWFYYSRGVPCTEPGEYSSNYAQVAYVTDATEGSQPGVDGIQTLNKPIAFGPVSRNFCGPWAADMMVTHSFTQTRYSAERSLWNATAAGRSCACLRGQRIGRL